MAWVVYPERAQKAPVVIAIHENTGLNTWTRSVADQLAAEGFIGIAPDMTTMGKTGSLTEDAPADVGRQLIQGATPEFVNAALDAVAKYGMSLPAAQPKYGVIGFCWGGGRSFLHATHAPTLGASVVYYGSPPNADQLAAIRAPVRVCSGGADARSTTIPATDSDHEAPGTVIRVPHLRWRRARVPARTGEQRGERKGSAGSVAEDGRIPEGEVGELILRNLLWPARVAVHHAGGPGDVQGPGNSRPGRRRHEPLRPA
jgi:dienelactone hydrolase